MGRRQLARPELLTWQHRVFAYGATERRLGCRGRRRGWKWWLEVQIERCPGERQRVAVCGMMKPIVANLDEALG